MDKYEYKVRSEEIRALIAQGEYEEAAQLADTIDWRRVRSVMMLCTISDLYKINRRYEDSRDMLLLAYERHPGGRTIVYSLCELSIKMGDVVQAVEYYKEFVLVAPKDSGRYILQYKLYEAQEVSLEERIAVLEELKKRDYREKWAYELAYLYHRVGLATRCVEECDELILWFGEGKYVVKAMELKMLHQPLTEVQQEKYDHRFSSNEEITETVEKNPKGEEIEEYDSEPTKEIPSKEVEIQVQTMDVSNKFNTINLQKELAESMRELMPTVEEHETKVSFDESTLKEAEKEVEEEQPLSEEVFFGETGEIVEDSALENQGMTEICLEEEPEIKEEIEQEEEAEQEEINQEEEAEEELKEETYHQYDKMLGMEYDGQIRLVVPESEKVEKQITGQIRIEDVLLEWERMKKESEQKRMEAVRQHVLEQTGNLFTEFDAAVRDGLLEKLEKDSTVETEDSKEEVQQETLSEESTKEDLPTIEPLEEDLIEEESIEESVEEEFTEEEFIEEEPTEEEFIEEEPTEEPVEEEFEEESTEESVEGDFIGEDAIEESFIEDTEESSEENKENQSLQGEGNEKIRSLTKEEKELFDSYAQSKHAKEQLIEVIDTISMAAYTGNIIVTGEEGTDTVSLAKNLVKNVQMSDANFSGKMAKISGKALNTKDVLGLMQKMQNGALIITRASDMTCETVEKLVKVLSQEEYGFIVVLEDTSKNINKFLEKNPKIKDSFNARFDLEALDNKALAEYGRRYAKELEFSIDEMGMLALYTRIADMQTNEHAVTIDEVREIVDEAIHHADKKNFKHFIDIIAAKRYDEEDMIILKERDFI